MIRQPYILAVPAYLLSELARDGPLRTVTLADRIEHAGLARDRQGVLRTLYRMRDDDGLVRARHVEGESGPPELLWSITPEGRSALAEALAFWRSL